MVGLCRLCASVRKKESLVAMSAEVRQQLRECFGLETGQRGDSLPRSVCSNCVQQLQSAYDFYKKVQESQESLSSLFDAKASTESVERYAKSAVADEYEMIAGNELEADVAKVEVLDVSDARHDVVTASPDDNLMITKEAFSVAQEQEQQEEDFMIEVYEVLKQCNNNDHQVRSRANSESDGDVTLIRRSIRNTKARTDVDADSSTADECETDVLDACTTTRTAEDQQTLLVTIVPEESTVRSDKEDVNFEDVSAGNKVTINQQQNAEDPSEKLYISAWADYLWCCYLCPEAAQTPQALHAHVCETHGKTEFTDLVYKCMDCQKVFIQYSGFLNHVRLRHHTELALRCDVCDVLLESTTQLATHRRLATCSDASPLPAVAMCAECGKCFFNGNAVQVHARVQHQQDAECHQCDLCEKSFKRVGALRAHQRIHSDTKEFSCDLCGRAFRQKANLDVHLYAHISEKNFSCSICHKRFKTSVNLEKHQLIHKEIKRFKCDYCDRHFRTKDAKRSHERIHTGEMPYKCEYCDRSFRFRSTFVGHINTHTGERPYSCIECNHHFSNWPNYNKHMKRRHSGADGSGNAVKIALRTKL